MDLLNDQHKKHFFLFILQKMNLNDINFKQNQLPEVYLFFLPYVQLKNIENAFDFWKKSNFFLVKNRFFME